MGRQTEVIDALGNVTTSVYDADGRVVCTLDPLGHTATNTYDMVGRRIEVIDPEGHVTTTVYDFAGRVEATIDPLGKRTSFAYDKVGRRVSVTDALGHVTTTAYDDAGRVESVTDPLGNRTTFAYDDAGRQITVTNALGQVSTTTYDAVGRVGTLIDAMGHVTSYAYDAVGHQVEVTDANGHVRSTQYDPVGRLSVLIDAKAYRTTYVYDGNGNRTEAMDPNRNMTTTLYDARNAVILRMDPMGHRVSLVYDAVGRLSGRQDPLQQFTSYAYDAAGRQTTITYADTSTVTFVYDKAGRMTGRTDAAGIMTYTYDAAGRETLVVHPGGRRVTYTYGDSGLRDTMVVHSGGTYTYSYDAGSRLTTLSNARSERTTWAYDALGRVVTLTFAGGATATYTYDAAGRITGVRNTKASGALIDGGVYYHDPVGNPTHAALAWGSRVTYTYDENDRLVRERRLPGAPYDHTFTYDGAGNRLTKVDSGVTTTYAYDASDRLLTEDAAGALTTYSWDDAGNNTLVEAAAGLTTMAWDCENRLRTIQVAGGSVVTNTYDADGLRRKREEDADTVLFMWDGQRLLRESDASYVTQALYSAALGDYGPMISQYRASGGTRLLHPDAQGTITHTTNTTGSSVDSYIFDAFGEPISVTGYSVNPHRFIGQQGYFTEPALGLDYVRARWYRPGTGSWLSADPVPSEPQYQYVGSRPTVAVDPGGRQGGRPVPLPEAQKRVVAVWSPRKGPVPDKTTCEQDVVLFPVKLVWFIRSKEVPIIVSNAVGYEPEAAQAEAYAKAWAEDIQRVWSTDTDGQGANVRICTGARCQGIQTVITTEYVGIQPGQPRWVIDPETLLATRYQHVAAAKTEDAQALTKLQSTEHTWVIEHASGVPAGPGQPGSGYRGTDRLRAHVPAHEWGHIMGWEDQFGLEGQAERIMGDESPQTAYVEHFVFYLESFNYYCRAEKELAVLKGRSRIDGLEREVRSRDDIGRLPARRTR